ncbi:MAG TPA: hypothetical protein VF889_06670 [Bacteroidota bacterium]
MHAPPVRAAAPFRTAAAALVLVGSLALASCSNVAEVYRELEADVAGGNYLRAIQVVRANSSVYGEKARVLYNLDLGLLYHYAGYPDSSSRYLFTAEREIQDLYTKSISLAAISFLTNDNVLPYDGEDFEKVMINAFLALNYAQKGEADEALVEARKVDLKLRELSREYQGKNRYQEDAFVRYLAGVLYETGGELNDAFISYRKALEAYGTYAREFGTPAPHCLLDDLVRTAAVMGFEEDARRYEQLGGRPFAEADRNLGSILVVAYAGRGPVKQEVRPSVTVADSAGTLHTFQIALPKFVPRMKGVRTFHVRAQRASASPAAEPEASGTTQLAQNLTAIAEKCLDDRLTLVYLKSGGRALLKFLAAEKAKAELKKKDDKLTNLLGSLAVDLAVGASEQADLRAWGTLPAQIQLARLSLPPGIYTVSVRASDGGREVASDSVAVRPGKTEFVIVDDIR